MEIEMFKGRRHAIATTALLLMGLSGSGGVWAQGSPTCIDPPPIGGPATPHAAPAGWSVYSNTPDVIVGDGPWPGLSGEVIYDVSGPSASGGTMGFFLGMGINRSYYERWSTTLTGLTAGTTYRVALEWQQASIRGGAVASGGGFQMTVDGNSTDYAPVGSAATDTWQTAVKTFVATGPTAQLIIGTAVTPGFNGAVVADSGAACSVVAGPTAVPVSSPAGLAALGLLLAAGATFSLRRRAAIR